MVEIQGKYNKAKVFTDNIEETAFKQILEITNQKSFENSNIAIMPDVHAGKGCVVGFTATSEDYIIPNIVGVDIGCGVLAVRIGKIDIDYEKLDKFIRNNIPSGASVNTSMDKKTLESLQKIKKRKTKITLEDSIDELSTKTNTDTNRHKLSLGSLGGGNHFIEIAEDSRGHKWILVHSGSRNFGLQIARYHQKKAEKYIKEDREKEYQYQRIILIEKLKKEGRDKDIEVELKKIKDSYEKIPQGLEYLTGEDKEEYLQDLGAAIAYSQLNRGLIVNKILKYLDVTAKTSIDTIHNYIDKKGVIRKGAVSAKKGKELIIPINMRDGSILCRGKGNDEWNQSAPHGAGRILSRSKAKEELSMSKFKKDMENIYSTSVKESTLDESPDAYKDMEEIIKHIEPTVKIMDRLKTVYNFKA